MVYVAASYLLPWWNRVYFLWDDIELLMQLRNPAVSTFLSSHQYQFFPVFKLFYSSEIQLFGVNSSLFLLTSVALHIVNIYLVYTIIFKLTKNHSLGLMAAILVSFNKSYFTIIFWPTMQTYVLLTTFTLSSILLFLRLQQHYRLSSLLRYFTSIVAAGFSVGFGIWNGFLLSLAAFIYVPRSKGKWNIITAGILASIITSMGILTFSRQEIVQNQLLHFSFGRIVNMVFFIAVGISQAIISRFFLPGFIPNIYSVPNVAIMIVLPGTVLMFFTYATISEIKKRGYANFLPLFLFAGFFITPYVIASLARSGPGALGGIAERYIYLPFFFFILTLSYAVFLSGKNLPAKIRKHQSLLNAMVIGTVGIVSIGHQLAVHMATSHLFL